MTGRLQNLVWAKALSALPTGSAVPLVDGAYMLAEGVVWCSRKQELWWVGESFFLLCSGLPYVEIALVLCSIRWPGMARGPAKQTA